MAKVGSSKTYDARKPEFAVGVSVDTSQLAQFSEKLKQWPAAVNQAMVNAINDTLKQGRRKAAQIMSAKYNIKQSDVIGAVMMERANRKQSHFTGKLTIHPSRRPGLAKFGAKQVKKQGGGVTYKTLRGKGNTMIKGAFAYPSSGKAQWVAIQSISHINKGKDKAEKAQKRRTRLKFLQGISVWGMFASLDNRPEVEQRMAETFMDNLTQQVNFQFLARTNQIPGAKIDSQGWIRRSGKRK